MIYYFSVYIGKHAKESAFNDIQHIERPCSYLPYGDDYNNYRWPILGQTILLCDTGGMQLSTIKKFAAQLFISGAEKILIFSEEHKQFCIFQHKGV